MEKEVSWQPQSVNYFTGCDKVSAGCENCTAESKHAQMQRWRKNEYRRPFAGAPSFWPKKMGMPARRQKPTIYTANSMSDTFHEEIPDYQIDMVIKSMRDTPQHLFLVMTKRAKRMYEWVNERLQNGGTMPGNIWLGVSVENRKMWDERCAFLKMTPAARRFVSVEPLLDDLGDVDMAMLAWIIVGGEVGSKAREMRLAWAASLAEQCTAAGTAYYFKQMGAVLARRYGMIEEGALGRTADPLERLGRKRPDMKLEHPYIFRREMPQW